MTETEERALVCKVADTWLGTPYLDKGRVRGGGVDCAMLLAEVFHEAVPHRVTQVDVDYYSEYWYLSQREHQRLIQVVERYAHRVERTIPLPGDIALFAPQLLVTGFHKPRAPLVSHGAIVLAWPRVIHSWKPGRMVQYDDADGGELNATFAGFWSVWP